MLHSKFSVPSSLIIYCVASLLFGCSTTDYAKVNTFDSVQEDQTYYQVLRNNLKKASIIKNFETRHILSAVILTPPMVNAIDKREDKILGRTDSALLITAKKNLSFFVSAYSLEFEENFLERDLIWKITLQVGSQKYRPTSVRLMSQKSYTSAYFDFSDSWSRDYLISFEIDPKGLNLIDKSYQADLNMSNKDGEIVFSW